ncbi:hypothetical protein D3C74_372340 [compost metagenome]
MHITCGYDRFVKLCTYIDDFTDRCFDLFGCSHQTFIHQMHIHGKWLDLQYVIELGDLFRFFERFVKYPFFTARYHNKAFTQINQF